MITKDNADAVFNEAESMIQHYTSLLITLASYSPGMGELDSIPNEVGAYVDEITSWVEKKVEAEGLL